MTAHRDTRKVGGIPGKIGPSHVIPPILNSPSREQSDANRLSAFSRFPGKETPVTLIGSAAVEASLRDPAGSLGPSADGIVSDWTR